MKRTRCNCRKKMNNKSSRRRPRTKFSKKKRTLRKGGNFFTNFFSKKSTNDVTTNKPKVTNEQILYTLQQYKDFIVTKDDDNFKIRLDEEKTKWGDIDKQLDIDKYNSKAELISTIKQYIESAETDKREKEIVKEYGLKKSPTDIQDYQTASNFNV